jgi:hypothetical protein
VSDLKEAIALATPLPEVRGDFRINVTTMHIILSRVYLYMEKWSDVVAHADTAFQRGIQYLDLTTYPSYVAGTTPPSYLRYENSSEVQWVYGQIANLPSHYNPSIEVRTMLAGVKDARCVVGFSISKEENTVNKVFQSKVTGSGNILNQAIRTAEACLNRAEAKIMRNQGNDLAEAETDLNDLRKNRIFAPYTEIHGLSQAELIDFIKAERFLEFFGEHFRWFDLRRWGMPEIKHRYKHSLNEDVVTYTLNKKDPMYTLPFPSSLGLNNLSLVQNPSRAMPDRIPEY